MGPGRPLYRLLFLAAALDQLACGLWALLQPQALFALLAIPDTPKTVPDDRLLLWQALGAVALVHAVFLLVVLWRPEAYAAALLVPLSGQLLGTALWLFVYASPRLEVPSRLPLLVLAIHAAVWLPPFAWFLFTWLRWRRAADHSFSLRRPFS